MRPEPESLCSSFEGNKKKQIQEVPRKKRGKQGKSPLREIGNRRGKYKQKKEERW